MRSGVTGSRELSMYTRAREADSAVLGLEVQDRTEESESTQSGPAGHDPHERVEIEK
jgi:hypothetical protein